MLAANNLLGLVERYRNGEICIVANIRLDGSAEECELVFLAIPPETDLSGWPTFTGARESHLPAFKGKPSQADRDKDGVLLCVGKPVECPNGIIPSLVRLEPAKQRQDFRRQILASLALDNVVQPSLIISHGKEGVFRFDLSARDRGGVTGLIENSPQIGRGVEDHIGEMLSQCLCKLDLVKLHSGLSVFLHDQGPCLLASEGLDFGGKIIDVAMCICAG